MTTILACPKCNGKMEEGWMREQHVTPIYWNSGKPDTSWSGLLKAPKNSCPVIAYRCSHCGYLELYAQPDSRQ